MLPSFGSWIELALYAASSLVVTVYVYQVLLPKLRRPAVEEVERRLDGLLDRRRGRWGEESDE